MTPAQLDHLRRIDAHLANLLAIAEKRTPGEWHIGSHDSILGKNEFDFAAKEEVAAKPKRDMFWSSNAAFISSCAGNAEAGWRATRAAIKAMLAVYADLSCEPDTTCVELALSILTTFPNI